MHAEKSVLKSVLIVDDDPDIRSLLHAALRPKGLSVESACDGVDALSRLRNKPFDLILLDILMPAMDGLTLLPKVHQIQPDIKVVVMTAANTPANLIASIREQAFSYFSKPFSTDAVVDTVLRALEATVDKDEIEVMSARPEWISLEVRCRLETADRLAQFFRALNMGLTPEQQEHVITAFRELLMNAIEHGAHWDPAKKVHLTYIRTPRAVIYYIRDPGEGFSMENLPHAAVSNPPNAPIEHAEVRNHMGMRPGGFGILLTRQLVDDVIYNEKGNEVLLIKYLNGGTPPGNISSAADLF